MQVLSWELFQTSENEADLETVSQIDRTIDKIRDLNEELKVQLQEEGRSVTSAPKKIRHP
jgi:hypothetical protein